MDKKNEDTITPLHTDDAAPLTLRIKCSSPGVGPSPEPSGDYSVTTAPTATILALKESVRDVLGTPARGRYLRLISSGRLLAPDMANVGSFKLREGDCVHAVLAAAGVRGGQQAAMSRGLPVATTRSRRNRLAAGLLMSTSSSDEDSDDDVEAGRERLGFDRLRATGLTRDEIAAIRIYFSRQVDRFIEQRNRLRAETGGDDGGADGDSDAGGSQTDGENGGNGSGGGSGGGGGDRTREDRLRMEDEWMERQGPNSEFRLNLNASNPLMMAGRSALLFSRPDAAGLDGGAGGGGGLARPGSMVGTDRDFIWGFILGFFVGFIMLFWVWMPTVPHKQKLGILTGISFQLGLNLMKAGETQDIVDA